MLIPSLGPRIKTYAHNRATFWSLVAIFLCLTPLLIAIAVRAIREPAEFSPDGGESSLLHQGFVLVSIFMMLLLGLFTIGLVYGRVEIHHLGVRKRGAIFSKQILYQDAAFMRWEEISYVRGGVCFVGLNVELVSTGEAAARISFYVRARKIDDFLRQCQNEVSSTIAEKMHVAIGKHGAVNWTSRLTLKTGGVEYEPAKLFSSQSRGYLPYEHCRIRNIEGSGMIHLENEQGQKLTHEFASAFNFYPGLLLCKKLIQDCKSSPGKALADAIKVINESLETCMEIEKIQRKSGLLSPILEVTLKPETKLSDETAGLLLLLQKASAKQEGRRCGLAVTGLTELTGSIAHVELGNALFETELALNENGYIPPSRYSVTFSELELIAPEVVLAFSKSHFDILRLNRLVSLPGELAAELANLDIDRLELDGLTQLDEVQAAQLARFKGSLSLNGLRTLPLEIARIFATDFTGEELCLNGLVELRPEIAETLRNQSCFYAEFPEEFRNF